MSNGSAWIDAGQLRPGPNLLGKILVVASGGNVFLAKYENGAFVANEGDLAVENVTDWILIPTPPQREAPPAAKGKQKARNGKKK